MKVRDTIKDKQYYTDYIRAESERVSKFIHWITIGRTPKDRIKNVKNSISEIKIGITIGLYSSGSDYEIIKKSLLSTVNSMSNSWDGFWKLKNTKGKELNQYILSAYDEMIWMLSLGYLLDIPNEDFRKLVDVIDKDNVKDFLFEFIIRAKLQDREPIKEESYSEYFFVPKVFEKLRMAIQEKDNSKSEILIKDFLEEWYNNHKEAGWYDSHKSKHNTFFGYWSFETAAVVAIMKLDDSSFRDNQYYPKDLVDYYRKNHSTT